MLFRSLPKQRVCRCLCRGRRYPFQPPFGQPSASHPRFRAALAQHCWGSCSLLGWAVHCWAGHTLTPCLGRGWPLLNRVAKCQVPSAFHPPELVCQRSFQIVAYCSSEKYAARITPSGGVGHVSRQVASAGDYITPSSPPTKVKSELRQVLFTLQPRSRPAWR